MKRDNTDHDMIHLDEQTIAQYVLKAPEVEPRRAEIAKHLKRCNGCKQLFKEVSAYYTEFQKLQQQSLQTLPAIVAPDRALRSYTSRQDSSIAAQKRTLPQRFMESFRSYPARWSAGFVTVITGLVLLTAKFAAGDTNPAYARAKDEFLIVYNKHGDELWRKHAGVGFDYETMLKAEPEMSTDDYFKVVDVDGDGKNEVVASYGWMSQPLAAKSNVIVCYKNNGEDLWRFPLDREMIFGTEKFSNDYHISKMIVGDFEGNGKIEIIASALHVPYYPTAIIRLDAKDGHQLDVYWNPGASPRLLSWDINRDGKKEVFVVGTNNGYNQASLAVFDPRAISGHAPAPPDYTPAGVAAGKEEYYILFPRSDVNTLSNEKRNNVHFLRLTPDNLLEVYTAEVQAPTYAPGVIYYFDRTMACVRVIGNDYFEQAYQKLQSEGKIKKSLHVEYDELRQGVRYWDGGRFVKERMMNQKYKVERSVRNPAVVERDIK